MSASLSAQALHSVAALCVIHASDLSIDEAAACLAVADDLRSLFSRCHDAPSPVGDTEATVHVSLDNPDFVIRWATPAVAVAATVAVAGAVHHTNFRIAPVERDDPVISPEAEAARALILDQLYLAAKELVGVTDMISRSLVPDAPAMSQGLAHVTVRITEAFHFVEDWIFGVPSTIIADMTFPSAVDSAIYMGRVSDIDFATVENAAELGGSSSLVDCDEVRPVRVGKHFACPFADPITFVCHFGKMPFRPQKRQAVEEHLRTQRKKHPVETKGFVIVSATPDAAPC